MTTIYTKSGAATADQAAAIIRAAGADALKRALAPHQHKRNATDELRPHISGKGRAHKLDWESVHKQIAPANTDGKGTMGPKYGSLRGVFLQHRAVQLNKIFGVENLEEVLAAEEVAEDGGRADVARKLEDGVYRAHQYAIVETLNVTSSARYLREPGRTFCNIYAHDFVVAQGGYLPRVWWKPKAWAAIQKGAEVVTPTELKAMQKRKEPTDDVVAPIYEDTVTELNANSLNKWFRDHGSRFGWREESDMTAAQDAVNKGEIGILSAANTNSKRSGHISVILAEDKDHQAARKDGKVEVPLQSQAGAKNFKYSAESGAPGSKSKKWWADKSHKDGAAFIFNGSNESPIATPEEVGLEGDE